MTKLTTIQFRPGINRENTNYSNENGWFDGNLIRFAKGLPEKIGGWRKDNNNTFEGNCRALHGWTSLVGTKFLGLGTTVKYYVEEGGSFYDITPLRSTTSAGDVTFAASNGSSTITATDSNHGLSVGDYVSFSGAASLGGLVTADVLNQENSSLNQSGFVIVSVPTVNSYTFTVPVTANSSDSSNGGSSVIGYYQLQIGLDAYVSGTGELASITFNARVDWESVISFTDNSRLVDAQNNDIEILGFGECAVRAQ